MSDSDNEVMTFAIPESDDEPGEFRSIQFDSPQRRTAQRISEPKYRDPAPGWFAALIGLVFLIGVIGIIARAILWLFGVR